MERDLQLSINILNKVESEVGGALSPELLQEVLLPTFVKNDAYVKLAQVEDCVYLKHGSRSLNDDDDESMDHLLLHRKVPYSTAEYFNVRTLQNSMLDPDELGFGEECGQEEKLVDSARYWRTTPMDLQYRKNLFKMQTTRVQLKLGSCTMKEPTRMQWTFCLTKE